VIILNPSDLVEIGSNLPRAGWYQIRPDTLETRPQLVEPSRKRLLVADDSLTTRTLVRSILEAAGYDVVVAADGVDALTILRTTPIDLVVSDVDMPRLDGFALTAEIRRDPKLQGIPIVLVTSLEAPEYRERGVAAGADAYIVKSGFDESEFLETISRWV
jgi:two-component system chemotaxis sensor kinase CheA